jgi:hypothetical protein
VADKDCLQRMQKRAVKVVSGLKENEFAMQLQELGMTTLEERHHQADMHMVHKIMHTESGQVPGTWFERAGNAVHVTKSGTEALTGRLKVKGQFFSMRVISD